MPTSSPVTQPEIQAELISEAFGSADVGFLVWDDNRPPASQRAGPW